MVRPFPSWPVERGHLSVSSPGEFEKSQIECRKHQDNPDVGQQPFQYSMPEEKQVHANDYRNHYHGIKHAEQVSRHLNLPQDKRFAGFLYLDNTTDTRRGAHHGRIALSRDNSLEAVADACMNTGTGHGRAPGDTRCSSLLLAKVSPITEYELAPVHRIPALAHKAPGKSFRHLFRRKTYRGPENTVGRDVVDVKGEFDFLAARLPLHRPHEFPDSGPFEEAGFSKPCYHLSMLRPRPAKSNKRIRESTLLTEYPFLADIDMLKARILETGVKYVIYDGSLETYYIAFVDYDGSGKLLARHRGRVEDLDWLFSAY